MPVARGQHVPFHHIFSGSSGKQESQFLPTVSLVNKLTSSTKGQKALLDFLLDRQKSLFRNMFNIKKDLSFGSTSNIKESAVLERARADNFHDTFSPALCLRLPNTRCCGRTAS